MTNIKLTQRDYEIIDFIKTYKCADTSTLTALFFPSKATCEKRMKKLCECRKLNRSRENILSEYIYYKGSKPSNLKHSLAIAKVYSLLQSNYQVVKYRREFEMKYYNKVLRADLMTVIRIDNKLIPLLIEIDLSKKYNEKYTSYIKSGYYKMTFPMQPIIIVISNRTPVSSVDITWIKLNEIEKLGSLL